MRALSTEGIQKGHMALHARQIAISAGASDDQVDRVVEAMLSAGQITAVFAGKLLQGLNE